MPKAAMSGCGMPAGCVWGRKVGERLEKRKHLGCAYRQDAVAAAHVNTLAALTEPIAAMSTPDEPVSSNHNAAKGHE